ncbi:hypothetical protein [Humidisolicoccus flavus]
MSFQRGGWSPKSSSGKRVLMVVVAIGAVAVGGFIVFAFLTGGWR